MENENSYVIAEPQPIATSETLLLRDKRNQAFLDRTSATTSREQDAKWTLVGVVLLSLIICVPTLLIAAATFTKGKQLVSTGRSVAGVIINKRDSTDTHGRATDCYVTYRFSVGVPTYEREVLLSNRVCPTLTTGEEVQVFYNPHNPDDSDLKVAIDTPKYPLWLPVVFCLFAILAIRACTIRLIRERHLSANGMVVYGKVVTKDVQKKGHQTILFITYRFKPPNGITIESKSEGPRWRANLPDECFYFGPKDFSVAVLYSSQTEFGLL